MIKTKWEKEFKTKWNKAKALNLDFRGIKDKYEFIERVLGNEVNPLTLAFGADFRQTTIVNILIPDEEMEWDFYSVETTYSDAINTIKDALKEHKMVMIEFTGEKYKNGQIITSNNIITTMKIKR